MKDKNNKMNGSSRMKWIILATSVILVAICTVVVVRVGLGGKKNDIKYDISYADYDDSILLFASGKNLLTNGGSSTLTMYIPKGNEPESFNIYNNRMFLQTVEAEDLCKGDDATLNGGEYASYTYELNTEAMEDDSNSIFVAAGDSGSNTTELFKPLVMTEEDVQLTYDTLCSIADISNEMLNTGEEFTSDDYMDAVLKYLRKNKNIVSFELVGSTVYFTMTNGETSFFAVSEADGTFSTGGSPDDSDINGAYSEEIEIVEGDCDPLTYFDPVQNRNENITTTNPNVLIMAPIRQAENAKSPLFNLGAANGNAEEALGKKIASELYMGSYDLKINRECDANLVRRWDEYGTILLNTHGPDNDDLLTYDNRKLNDKKCASTYFMMGSMYGFSPINHGMDEFKALGENWECATDDLEENRYYWKRGGIYRGIKLTHLNVLGVVECSVFVTSDHMMYLLEDAEFENTVFVFDVCNGLSDDLFNDFLLSKGASCIWGYTESVNGETSQALIADLYDYFFAVEAQTDHSKHTTLISESQSRTAGFFDVTLECRRPDDGVLYTYDAYTELTGTVTDELSGEPVKNVKINVYRYYNGEKRFYKDVKTGDDGTYTISQIPYGIYMLEGVYGDRHIFINFSIGHATQKVVNFEVSEYIPISTYEGLCAISENLSGKYYLMNDITLEESFVPIGLDQDDFEGIFLGNGHTIFNVNSPLFASTSQATIKDLNLVTVASADPLPSLKSKYDNYGLLASTAYRTSLYNCTAAGSVSAVLPDGEGGNVGGFVGHFEDSTMENCSSSITITIQTSSASIRGGGFAGFIKNSTLRNSCNTGNISLTSMSNDIYLSSPTYIRAGGIAGEGTVTLETCCNTGSISAKGGHFEGSQAGGLLGNGTLTATASWNSGTVSAYMPTQSDLGLIDSVMTGNSSVGSKEEADSFRAGINNVNFMFWYESPPGGYAGGFVGTGKCYLTDCYNSGDVVGSYCVGGIIGKSRIVVATNVVNFGTVTGSYCTGGFVGYIDCEYFGTNTNMKSCYVLGPVGSAYICAPFAGIVDNKAMETTNCFYSDSTGIDSSLEVVHRDSVNHVFSPGADINSVLADTSFDFENVWGYDTETGRLSLKSTTAN